MKEYKLIDLEVNYCEPIVIDCPVEGILGGSIADLIYKATTQYIIIITPWDMVHRENYDFDNPHTWLLSAVLYQMSFYNIEFDGWEYKDGVDYNDRDYFRINGYTANKELLEELESAMHCICEFDISYGMYNFDDEYNILN